jgi:hypothetical protein
MLSDNDLDIYHDQMLAYRLRNAVFGTACGSIIGSAAVGISLWLLLGQPDTALVAVLVSQAARACWLGWKASRAKADVRLLERQLGIDAGLL